MPPIILDAMFAGRPAPLGPNNAPSAIVKSALSGPWTISDVGLVGDEQADLKNHGGTEKALHHYCRDHYADWATELPGAEQILASPAAFGENISAAWVCEADVCVGDVLRVGSVTLQVSQGRQPCWKLNARFGVPDMAIRVQQSGRNGWYYRVIEAGAIEPGDTLSLADRPQPGWSIRTISTLLYHRKDAYDDLAALAEVPELAESWRSLARRPVEKRAVEDWTPRLQGPNPDRLS